MIDESGFIRITDRLSRFSKIAGEMVPHMKLEEQVQSFLTEAFRPATRQDKESGAAPRPTPAAPAPAPVPAAAPPRTTAPPLLAQPPAPAPSAAVEVAGPSAPGDSLEVRIGSRWLLYIGIVAIVVGVSYFEKLAIDNHWVTQTARVIQGAIAGFVLVAAGLRFVRKGYAMYGQLLSGAGVAILYVSTFAAFDFYQLISGPLCPLLLRVPRCSR